MNVCLIWPPTTIPKKSKWGIQVSYPIGIAYIASYLESKDIHVDIVDSVGLGWRNITSEGSLIRIGLSDNDLRQKIKSSQPDVVGIGSMFTPQIINVYRVADIVKSIDSSIPVVVGGLHASNQPLETLSYKNIDVVVQGEGEITMYELVQHYMGKKKIEDVDGLYYKVDRQIQQTKPRKLISNLDELPYPAYHLLPMEEYFKAGKEGISERAILVDRWASMITSRGCPFQCFFCAPRSFGRSWRGRAPEKVVAEIQFLVDKYGIRHIFFEDDNMTLDIKRAEKIFDLIIERELDITWETPNGVRADALSRSLLEKMKKSGCKMLVIAPETGDQQFLNEVIKKRMNLEKVLENSKIISEEGISCAAFFIIGLAGENKKSVDQTIRFARKLARMGIIPRFQIAFPLPMTEFYNISKEKGYLLKENADLEDWYTVPPLVATEDFTAQDIIRWKRKAVFLTALDMMLFKPVKLIKSTMHFVKRPSDVIKLIRRI